MKNIRAVIFVVILAIVFVISAVAHYFSRNAETVSAKNFDLIVAESVYNSLENELSGALYSSGMMANDKHLRSIAESETTVSRIESVNNFKEYLGKAKETSLCDTAFFISEKTKLYYTHNGLSKVIDPDKNAADMWYNIFTKSGVWRLPDVSEDDVNENKWTFFVNCRLEDENEKLLGVCGLGINFRRVQDIFSRYERKYGVNISLIDSNGEIQADSNTLNIKSKYMKMEQKLSNSDEYVYTSKGEKGHAVTKYVKELDWFLVVRSGDFSSESSEFRPIFAVISLMLFVLVAFLYVFIFKNDKRRMRTKKGEDFGKDMLTGLPNRDYFKEVYGERGIFNTARYKSIAVFDIDFFKEANDTKDGDAILTYITECAGRILGENSEIFRWGGDEFVVLMDWSIDFAYEVCKDFCREVAKNGQVTVSVGLTEVRLSETIKKNYYRAVQGCYLVKEIGGNGVKRN